MLRKFLLKLKARHLQALHEQKGQAIIIFTFAFIGLIAMLGLALDLGLVYIEKVKVNRTADAAALAAVVELPYEQDTINRAIDYIQLNGYDVGVDTNIIIRGCVVSNTTYFDSLGTPHVYTAGGAQNVGEPGFTNPMTRTTLITGAPYISVLPGATPRATFVVDTGGYQSGNPLQPTSYCAATNLGTATKLRVAGRVDVHMNFMQFFGFRDVPVQDEATAENLTSLDVAVVFDVSGSMEDQTICHDCWVRTNYSPNWPSNGYFNPIPYDKTLADINPPTGNQSVPLSALCTISPPQPFITGTRQYLVVEAELYSAIVGDWGLDVRSPGNGFWSIQRGTRGGSVLGGEEADQGNSAGTVIDQSSNLCRPNVQGGQIDCTVGNGNGGLGDDVCADDPGIPNATDIRRDCSAFIAARPIETYGQTPGNIPNLAGAAYNSDCFSGGILSGACWSNNPFNTVPGLETGPSSYVPYVEYDFTPTWAGNTYIWIRAIGGGEEAYTWAGKSPDQIAPDSNGGGTANNVTPWRKVIYWQVDSGNITQRKDNVNGDYLNTPTENTASNATEHFQRYDEWLVNRAKTGFWRWIRLGSTGTVSGTQSTLKLYQGSAGYLVDKIVFTNDTRGNTPEGGNKITAPTGNDIPEALRRDVNGNTVTAGFNSNPPSNAWRDSLGPPASWGSATREACNPCNPAFGYTVDPSECRCKKTANDTANGGYGLGLGCTLVTTTTNELQEQLLTGLYSGLQPIRSAQEAVKKFAKKLDPKFDQLAVVPFTDGAPNTAAQSDNTRRSKLQCLTWATTQLGNPARCYDPSLGTPLTYTNVLSVVEKQWPQGGTNIAIGMREGLEELGVGSPGNPAVSGACSATVNDGNACDRRGAARRIIILMTDGSPNGNPGTCAPGGGRPDLWEGLLGTEDPDFECAMYFAFLADQANVTVYTIGIGGGANRDLLTAMATGDDPGDGLPAWFAGEGQYFPAAKPTDLDLIFDQILSNVYVRIVG